MPVWNKAEWRDFSVDTCASRGCHAAASDSHMLMPINKSVYCNHKVKAVLLKDLISRRLALEKHDQWDWNFSRGMVQSERFYRLKRIPLSHASSCLGIEPKLCTCLGQTPPKKGFLALNVKACANSGIRNLLTTLPLLDPFTEAAFDVCALTSKPHSRSVCETWASLLPADPFDLTIRYPQVTSPPSEHMVLQEHKACKQ